MTPPGVYDFAVGLVREAGVRLKAKHTETIQVFYKGQDERDLVTAADKEISDFLIAKIKNTFPTHRVYSEEDSDVAQAQMGGYEWVLDPIDGTANFTRHIPHFAVCAALLNVGVPIVGAVYNPITDELFSFESGRGVFLNGLPISVTDITELKNAQSILIPGHQPAQWDWGGATLRSFLEHFRKTKAFGSSALDLCFLAAGRADVVVYGTLTTRDIAAAIGIVQDFIIAFLIHLQET